MLNSEEINNTFEIHMDEICTKFKVNSYSFLRISPPGKYRFNMLPQNRPLTPIAPKFFRSAIYGFGTNTNFVIPLGFHIQFFLANDFKTENLAFIATAFFFVRCFLIAPFHIHAIFTTTNRFSE